MFGTPVAPVRLSRSRTAPHLCFLAVTVFTCICVLTFCPVTKAFHLDHNALRHRETYLRNVVTSVPRLRRGPRLSRIETGKTNSGRGETELNAIPAAASVLENFVRGGSGALPSIGLLCFVVLIHELGHFSAARMFGITVKEFSVGVGPRLLGFQNDNIDYSLRILPFGGYVRFPENYNTTLFFEQTVFYERSMEDFKRLKANKKQDEVKKPKSSFQNMFQFLLPKTKSERFEKPEKPIIEYYDDPDLLQNRSAYQRAIVLVGGIVFNFVLAFSLYFTTLTIGDGMPRLPVQPGVLVTNTIENAPAYNKVYKGDVITKINNIDLSPTTSSSNKKTKAAGEKYVKNILTTVQSTTPGDNVVLSVRRVDPATKKLTDNIDVVRLVPISNDINTFPPSIGVMLTPNFGSIEMVRASSVAEGLKEAAVQFDQVTTETASALLSIISSLFNFGGASKSSSDASLSGPVAMIRTGSDVIENGNLAAVCAFAAAISINLGVVNSLPFPGLDGGQLAFVLAEALRGGRKIDQRIQEDITAVAFTFLIVISLSTVFGDVASIFK
uniref:Peptidase M50 domain-containing protein n=1 Tax=Corethron hystrix TaxID=216773 RepID=A0A7S1G2U9_9STRA|mmetsp:Transcript_9338/g.20645  ORF Transcript_9338/g.20645 Transcript_9338/m.20645 type:complete len:555 (+) Transcript_9338:35-1699(+)